MWEILAKAILVMSSIWPDLSPAWTWQIKTSLYSAVSAMGINSILSPKIKIKLGFIFFKILSTFLIKFPELKEMLFGLKLTLKSILIELFFMSFKLLPNSLDNHQRENAYELKNNNACILFEQKDFSEKSLSEKLNMVLSNKSFLREMSINAKSIYKKDAANNLIELILSTSKEVN